MYFVEEYAAGKWWLVRSFDNEIDAEDFAKRFRKARVKYRA
jgi:hypothetical protein